MVPFATLATVRPLWVQMALKALNSPALGWVTTIFAVSKTVPPPTGMSAALTTSLPEPAEPAAPLPALPLWFAVLLPPPQAVRVAAPATPGQQRHPRR